MHKRNVLILFPFATLMLSACSPEPTSGPVLTEEHPQPARIETVQAANTHLIRSYPGTLEAAEKADLAFRVSGELIELPARSGVRVHKGDLLARLDDTDYRNALDERQARYDLAKIQRDQAKQLLKKNLSSQLKFDQATAELKSARAALEQAKDNLAYTRLTAPFDAIIAQVNIDNYQPVQAQAPILQLRDDYRLDIRFSVPETLLSQLRQERDPEVIGSICGTVRFNTHPDKSYRACHKEHESIPDPLTRNYSAAFALDPLTDFAALPGMTASITIDFSPFMLKQAEETPLVPVEAVFDAEGQQWVWLVDSDMRARRTAIKTGAFEGRYLHIVDGLQTGDRIITAGIRAVEDGLLVKPLERERGL